DEAARDQDVSMAATRAPAAAATRRGALLVACAAVCWSSGGLIARLVATGPWTTSLWRGLFASPEAGRPRAGGAAPRDLRAVARRWAPGPDRGRLHGDGLDVLHLLPRK